MNAADWTARDVLIHYLRRIDSGEIKPTRMIVAYEDDENGLFGYQRCCPDKINERTTIIGLLERVKHSMLEE